MIDSRGSESDSWEATDMWEFSFPLPRRREDVFVLPSFESGFSRVTVSIEDANDTDLARSRPL